uniref:Lymphocyte antigen 9 n=1 Tax=Capra hircus TaxID=9925 RepID=A0A452ESV7_CAPHI
MASPRRHTDDWALQPFSKNQPHIFSPYLWTPLLFLLMGQGASEKDSASTVVKGFVGGSVILSLNISVDAEIEHITWSGPKEAFALALPSGKIFWLDKSYQGRINIPESNYLSINNLTLKDAGSYKARINQKGSKDIDERFILYIYEQLQEPQVTIQSVNVSENASCTITLVCSVEGAGGDIQYKWTSRDPHASESWGQSSSHPVHVSQFCTDLGASQGGPMGEMVLEVLGEPITLSLGLLDSQHIDNVVWMFNMSIIKEATANQLIEFKDPDQNTVWVSSQDDSLKIVQLKMEHAGIYHAYVCSNVTVASVKHINLRIYRPERSTEFWIGLSLVVLFILLGFGISGWCFWKQQRRWKPTAGHTPYSIFSQGYEKLDTLPKTARHASNSSSDSNGTTEEDEERTGMHQPVNGRDRMCDSVTKEEAGLDLDSEGQAEYDLITPDDMAPALVIEGEMVYTHVFLNLQGKTPVPQKKEDSATLYCSIQRTISSVVPPLQQNDLKSPEIPTYENVP